MAGDQPWPWLPWGLHFHILRCGRDQRDPEGRKKGRAGLRGSCCSLRTSGPRPGFPGWPPTPDSDCASCSQRGPADGPPPLSLPTKPCPGSCPGLLGASELHSEASSLDTGSGKVGQIAERATEHGFTPCPSPKADPHPTRSMASSWTRALPTRPCSSTSGRRTKRTTQGLWASTALAMCKVRVP